MPYEFTLGFLFIVVVVVFVFIFQSFHCASADLIPFWQYVFYKSTVNLLLKSISCIWIILKFWHRPIQTVSQCLLWWSPLLSKNIILTEFFLTPGNYLFVGYNKCQSIETKRVWLRHRHRQIAYGSVFYYIRANHNKYTLLLNENFMRPSFLCIFLLNHKFNTYFEFIDNKQRWNEFFGGKIQQIK